MEKKKLGDKILVKGYVTVWQGEGKDKKVIVKRAENHFVDLGLQGLLSALVGNHIAITAGPYEIQSWVYEMQMYLGDDTTTASTHGLTALVSPIGTAPGTPPSDISGRDRSNPSSGVWKASIVAVWYAGTVSGTVGELGMYLRPFTNITPGWYLEKSSTYTFTRVLVSRLSVGDGDFTSFTIDTSKSLTVQWDLEVSFA